MTGKNDPAPSWDQEEIGILEDIARDSSNRAAQVAAIRMLRKARPEEDAKKPAETRDPFAALEETDDLAARRAKGA